MFYSMGSATEEASCAGRTCTEEAEHGRADTAPFGADAVTTRNLDAPDFRGVTFREVRARSITNRVPGASRMPYRGCTHACVHFTA